MSIRSDGFIRVAVVEDHDAVRAHLESVVDEAEGMLCVATFPAAEELLASTLEEIDVVLMDIGLPGMSGVEAILPARKRWPAAEVLMLTIHQDEKQVFTAICNGAVGYLLKSTTPAKIVDAIRIVTAGGAPMTPSVARQVVRRMQRVTESEEALSDREREVLDGLIAGKTNGQIADALYVSTNTVAFHVKQIYRKLHVHSRAEAVARIMKRGGSWLGGG